VGFRHAHGIGDLLKGLIVIPAQSRNASMEDRSGVQSTVYRARRNQQGALDNRQVRCIVRTSFIDLIYSDKQFWIMH
jgi:hypothetical protein